MNPDLENLVVLQSQDLELRRLQAELAGGPQRVAAAESTLHGLEKVLENVQAALAGQEKLRRAQDSEIGTQQTKLARLQRGLDAATSAQQIAALEHEISFTRDAIQSTEEQAFASLEQTELLEGQQSTTKRDIEAARLALGVAQQAADSLKVHHGDTMAGIERERAALRASIEPVHLQAYDRLARARGTAVAEALGDSTGGKCAACQMGIRPQRWQDLTGRDHLQTIFTCETCGRMLFWDPRRDTPRPWLAGERWQQAQAGAAGSRHGGAR